MPRSGFVHGYDNRLAPNRFRPSSLHHLPCVAIISLNAMARPVWRLWHPLERLVRWRTVAKVLSIGFEVRMAYHTGQEISLDGLAQSSGVAKNTITRYLDYLEAAFLIVRIRRVDDTGKTFQRMRQFKVYLTNPSMRAALFAPISDEDDAMGTMVETAIFSQWFHSNLMKNLHYARWKQGRTDLEVDLVRVDPARLKPTWAYEIKWSDRYASDQPRELRGLIEFAKRNFDNGVPAGATTKTITTESEVDGVPIPHFPCALHCYQVGKNVAEERAP